MTDITDIEKALKSGRLKPLTIYEVAKLEKGNGDMRKVLLAMVREGKIKAYWDTKNKEVLYAPGVD